ncbi:MAG TPA: TRAM domain-containing protein [Candidatus Hydrogenedentes bacterium]|nr:TRAM domain-containing protein [Candidatus Hydrogenedentota bacterium]HPC17840.1 TRAM domain-containing protein [Candidatus Hydrogenedentota bacterium]HRT21741.1 TRAM domain-containing protein [Candidatus Hydrogenedentota bacterium]HRT65534.1 TRAM domain-containing protein [Candidatus Hydrogenedentota bacterium]
MSPGPGGECEIAINGLAAGGDGVGRHEGQVCFVPYGVPGDIARVRITRQTKSALWAEIREIVSPSPDRVEPACPYFGRCGGCCWQPIAYPVQEGWKRRMVAETLRRIGKVEAEVEWAAEPASPFGYRTRARFHAQGKAFGFLASGSHTVVDIENCPVCHDRLNAALARLREQPEKADVEVTVNPEGDETLVWTRCRALRSAFPEASSFLLDGVPIVNGCFSQASLILNRLLRRIVDENIGQPSSLLDLYCGNGNLSLHHARLSRVVGMDRDPRATRAASKLAPGAYQTGGEEAFRKALRKTWDVVLLDPPRTGAKAIMESLGKAPAGAIVYVSCDPATLARDLGMLAAHGWKPVRITAMDLFPHTSHVETVCRLERLAG